ncbi:MAG: DUF2306 domain-containing protein [Acidimicrobiales bacterium]
MPIDLILVYGALAVWAALLVIGFRQKSYKPFLWMGLAIMVVMNVRYLISGVAVSIPAFVGIYDAFDNLGLASDEGAPALATCVDNACSVWGDRYTNHSSWGVAFYDRFVNGPQSRRNMLYVHIFFNSVAFLLMHYQLARPGTGANRARHRLLGKVGFAAISLGTFFAVWLSTEHGSVSEYGGILSMVGFWSMSAFVYGTAIKGVLTARSGDVASHRVWMIRCLGSMWGAFWLFRVMLVVTGPLLRNYESASLLISIWFSAPLGLLIAESYLRRSAASPTRLTPSATAVAA